MLQPSDTSAELNNSSLVSASVVPETLESSAADNEPAKQPATQFVRPQPPRPRTPSPETVATFRSVVEKLRTASGKCSDPTSDLHRNMQYLLDLFDDNNLPHVQPPSDDELQLQSERQRLDQLIAKNAKLRAEIAARKQLQKHQQRPTVLDSKDGEFDEEAGPTVVYHVPQGGRLNINGPYRLTSLDSNESSSIGLNQLPARHQSFEVRSPQFNRLANVGISPASQSSAAGGECATSDAEGKRPRRLPHPLYLKSKAARPTNADDMN